MRTTLNLPEKLLNEAMKLTHQYKPISDNCYLSVKKENICPS